MYFLELVLLLATILIQKECFAGDGSLELQNGKNLIIGYYGKDQCMAQPGYFHLHHFSLAFYLQEHQICAAGPDGMEGLLICYRSQLEKSALLPMGMQPTRQYELRNLAGNGVAERCQELGPEWHGLLINTNDQRNWVLRFSTTNRTFIIDSGMEILEWLFYKLASAKDVGESFLSKIFNPFRDFMKWNNDHFGKAEEADNRIRHGGNEKLKMLFMERQAMEERLQEYAGIWSLGLDMLPTKEGIEHFEIYVNKSKCCQDIQVFFNQPTAQKPEQTESKVNFSVGPIRKAINIAENLNIVLNGTINSDANEFIFEIEDDPSKDKSNGMRFLVNFGEKSTIFQQKIGNEWTALDENPTVQNHFARGAPFKLVVIMRKNGITINVNCNRNVSINLTANTEIAFEKPHFINITGDYKYIDNVSFSDVTASLKYWIFDGGINAQNSGGIMLQGKIAENAEKFTIKLWRQNGDGSYESILQLEVGIKQKDYKLLIGPNNEECQNMIGPKLPFKMCGIKKMTHSFIAGAQFEGIFKFNAYNNTHQILIWMDNLLIADLLIDQTHLNVHFVQIEGDATAKMIKIRRNQVSCDYEMSSKNGKNLRIVGKMLPPQEDGFPNPDPAQPDFSLALKIRLLTDGHSWAKGKLVGSSSSPSNGTTDGQQKRPQQSQWIGQQISFVVYLCPSTFHCSGEFNNQPASAQLQTSVRQLQIRTMVSHNVLVLALLAVLVNMGIGMDGGNSVHFTAIDCPAKDCPYPNRCYAPDGLESPVVCGPTVPILHFPPDCLTMHWPLLVMNTVIAFAIGMSIPLILRRRPAAQLNVPNWRASIRQSFRRIRGWRGGQLGMGAMDGGGVGVGMARAGLPRGQVEVPL